jgi:hypothetical protein
MRSTIIRAAANRTRRAQGGSSVSKSPIPLQVAEVMNGYAQSGIFRSFSTRVSPRMTIFRVLWHVDRVFEIVMNPRENTLTMAAILPNVPVRSTMHCKYGEFIADFRSRRRFAHRRIDPAKCSLRLDHVKGGIGLTVTVRDGDFEYGSRKLIHVVNETYVVFLRDGPYQDYRIRELGENLDFL